MLLYIKLKPVQNGSASQGCHWSVTTVNRPLSLPTGQRSPNCTASPRAYCDDDDCCDDRAVCMEEASSVSLMMFSTSINVFHVTGCLPCPRTHRVRISRAISAAMPRQLEVI